MTYYVYIRKSQVNGRLYKGMTGKIDARIKDHNSGRCKSTKPYRPWELVYYEEYKTKEEARKREKFFRSGEGRELLKNILHT